MSKNIYSFVGTATALHFYLKQSDVTDRETALTASEDLQSVSEQLLTAFAGDTSEEAFSDLLDEHVVTILESIETIKGTQAFERLDQTLADLLEEFYQLADCLMGGGGCTLDHIHGPTCGVGSTISFTSFTQ